jgi:hypothetical protein
LGGPLNGGLAQRTQDTRGKPDALDWRHTIAFVSGGISVPHVLNALPPSHPRRAELEIAVRTILRKLDRVDLPVTIGDRSRPTHEDEPVPLTLVVGPRVIGAAIRPADDAASIEQLIRALVRT